jgi:hypothetical protein
MPFVKYANTNGVVITLSKFQNAIMFFKKSYLIQHVD